MKYKQLEIQKALDFFGLNIDYTMEELRKVYHQKIKNNHPDNHNGDKEVEERAKIINGYFSMLKSLKVENITIEKTKKETGEHQQQKEEEIREKEKLNQEKEVFRKNLQDTKRIYKDYISIVLLCDKYLTLLLIVYSKEELKNYQEKYIKDLNRELKKLKEADDFSFQKKKESTIRYFSFHLHQFINRSSVSDSIKATELYLNILKLIQKCNVAEFDKLLERLSLVQFKDINKDQESLNNIIYDYPIYINKLNANVVFVVDRNGKEVFYTRKILNSPARISLDRFEMDFISLEDFVKYSSYVGDRDVSFYNSSGFIRRELLPSSRYLYYDHITGLMLIYNPDDKDMKFSFFSSRNTYDFEDHYYFKINGEIKRSDPENGLYKDKEVLYRDIIDYIKEKNNIYPNTEESNDDVKEKKENAKRSSSI